MNINNQTHLETLVGSINKMFLNAENKAIIKNKELYLLNIISDLLLTDINNLISEKNKKKLEKLYFNILNKYKFLCKAKLCFDLNYKEKTYVYDNCYVLNETDKIIYWQENYTVTLNEITASTQDEEYISSKDNDNFINFAVGKTIEYNDIGKIIFLILDTNETNNITIKDYLDITVNDSFDFFYIDNINAMLLVSKNIYSNSSTKFKIIIN